MYKKLFPMMFVLALAVSIQAAELPPLIESLKSEDPAVETTARAEMQAMLAAASAPGVDRTALNAAEQLLLQELQSSSDVFANLWIIRMLELFGGDPSIAALVQLLNSEDAHLQGAACRALAANPSAAASQALLKGLVQAPDHQKAAFVDAISYRGDADLAKPVAALLKSSDPVLAGKAAMALGKMNSPRALTLLAHSRDHATGELKLIIELAMLTIGVDAEQAKELLLHGAGASIRVAAFKQLSSQKPADALQILKGDVPDRQVMLRAAMSVENNDLCSGLVAMLPEASAADQLTLLAAIGDYSLSQYEKEVVALLPNAEGQVREWAVMTLGSVGGADSFDALYQVYLKTPNDVASLAIARLKVPAVDARLVKTAAGTGDLAERLAAVKLLTVRASDGAVDQMNTLARPGQDEALRNAAFTALETLGDLDSCKLLATAITAQDPLMRSAQKALKKLSGKLAAPDLIWTSAYAPALAAAKDDEARKALLAVVDGVACDQSLAYLGDLLKNPEGPLFDAALQSLSRWPDFKAGEHWLALTQTGSGDHVAAAQKAIIRILTRDEIKAPGFSAKANFAALAIQQAPTVEFKKAIVDALAGTKLKNHQKRDLKNTLKSLVDDPDIGPQVKALFN